jgi:hypothetical protein
MLEAIGAFVKPILEPIGKAFFEKVVEKHIIPTAKDFLHKLKDEKSLNIAKSLEDCEADKIKEIQKRNPDQRILNDLRAKTMILVNQFLEIRNKSIEKGSRHIDLVGTIGLAERLDEFGTFSKENLPAGILFHGVCSSC